MTEARTAAKCKSLRSIRTDGNRLPTTQHLLNLKVSVKCGIKLQIRVQLKHVAELSRNSPCSTFVWFIREVSAHNPTQVRTNTSDLRTSQGGFNSLPSESDSSLDCNRYRKWCCQFAGTIIWRHEFLNSLCSSCYYVFCSLLSELFLILRYQKRQRARYIQDPALCAR